MVISTATKEVCSAVAFGQIAYIIPLNEKLVYFVSLGLMILFTFALYYHRSRKKNRMLTPQELANSVSLLSSTEISELNEESTTVEVCEISSGGSQTIIDLAAALDALTTTERNDFDTALTNDSSGSKRGHWPCPPPA